MKRNIFYSFTLMLLIVSCSSTKNNKNTLPEPYQPVDKKLYDTIVYLDTIHASSTGLKDIFLTA
ncbi:MAG TPA: hypothetical protein VMY77_17160 [Chitinophagaceae bacterium]|nr:hypothetical protein [Chitinophagaceae bacterium]